MQRTYTKPADSKESRPKTAGEVIMIELGEAAEMLGRKRIRLDAFSTLQKKLKQDYDVELKIYSRRTKV